MLHRTCQSGPPRNAISLLHSQMEAKLLQVAEMLQKICNLSIWALCAMSHSEHTLTARAEQGRLPMFTVRDLTADPRFNQLPFVTSDPYFEYYAGTPLSTKRGINIGSIYILDHNVRPYLNDKQVDFIGTPAQTIMRHLEAMAEAKDKDKIKRLASGMNAFVEGKANLASEIELSQGTLSGRCM